MEIGHSFAKNRLKLAIVPEGILKNPIMETGDLGLAAHPFLMYTCTGSLVGFRDDHKIGGIVPENDASGDDCMQLRGVLMLLSRFYLISFITVAIIQVTLHVF